jgi:hypothetical protein
MESSDYIEYLPLLYLINFILFLTLSLGSDFLTFIFAVSQTVTLILTALAVESIETVNNLDRSTSGK